MALPTKKELQQKHTSYSEKVIIDSVGKYLTRGKQEAEILEIGDPSKSSANCKGHLLFKNKPRKRVYSLWMPNGAYKFIGIDERDIVKKLKRET